MAIFNPLDDKTKCICPSCRTAIVPVLGGCGAKLLYIGAGAVMGSIIPFLGTAVGMVLGWLAFKRTRYCPACEAQMDMRDVRKA